MTLHMKCMIGKLYVKLAREAIFGGAVLKQCTPRGCGGFPVLPQVELVLLKSTQGICAEVVHSQKGTCSGMQVPAEEEPVTVT